MSVIIRRAGGQTLGAVELRNETGDAVAGFDADFVLFGNVNRAARLVAPDVKLNNSGFASYNAGLINDTLNSLPPGSKVVRNCLATTRQGSGEVPWGSGRSG